MTTPGISETIAAVWRIESARIVAGLARIVREIGVAEDLAQDALVAAFEQWPDSGIPRNPGAWLMGVAKHRAIDHLRRGQLLERKHGELAYEIDAANRAPDLDATLDDDVGDDMLRLIFTACHPVLPREARVALTLRLVAGLTTHEIARAFLVPEPTIAQRLVRAKKTLAARRVPFELPRGDEREARLASVLDVVYLIFNEGYTATAGADWLRSDLCEDALRLARMVAALAPDDAEASGLAALLEIQASRLKARVGPSGEIVLLADQNRASWDRLLIQRGLAALSRAERLSVVDPVQQVRRVRGPYTLQAAIAACHARAASVVETDWRRIVSIYDELLERTPSPVVALNRAVAVAMADGPEAGLVIIDALANDPALKSYHLLPAVRGDMLEKIGRADEARTEFQRAASLTRNEAERDLLLRRARFS